MKPLNITAASRADESDDGLFMELEALGCLSPVAEKVPSPAIAQLIWAPLLVKPEEVAKPTQKRLLYPGRESICTPKSKKRRAQLPIGRGDRPKFEDGCQGAEQSTPQLLPDGSGRQFRLPVIAGRHPDLKTISGSTLSDLLDGLYAGVKYRIIDSRYPYEYEGGHVKTAENIFTEDMIEECFMDGDEKKENTDLSEVVILIFHCEFSAERGPRLMRHLRNVDRQRNGVDYPKLKFPEIYVLEGGYHKFFESFSRHCAPRAYVKMLDKNFQEDMKKFRRKSKSLNADGTKRTDKTKIARSRSGLHF